MVSISIQPGSWFRCAWRLLTNVPWWLPLILVLLLTLDTCSLPNSWHTRSTVGTWIRQHRRELGPHPIGPLNHRLVRYEDGLEGISYGWDYELGKRTDGEEVADILLFGPVRSESGVWGMTRRTIELHPHDIPTEWTDARKHQVGQMIDDRLADDEFPDDSGPRLAAQMFRDGTYTITEPLIGGYIHNAFALLLTIGFLWSAALGRPWRSAIAWRSDYRLSRSKCPRCCYHTRGYPGTICPECGLDWTEDHLSH